MVSTMRIFNFPAQGIHTLTKALLLKRLHSFEKDKRHIRKISTTSRGGETPDRVNILLITFSFSMTRPLLVVIFQGCIGVHHIV